ncbi:GNAT family N-acetyltransferase [Hymenobacter profundi]|uniref:GNAT family N-acetyltransferase n=1 Tax=Hymenobacter profundi TaxID=1982110 RepID=A0ABS6X3F4_9BACT|nr:GNAT family N-acetyltransferase [Hymenobacter profundi]MBW3129479.1 GNAT family N-acetyltransferase [Hymenobacter profundi]
MQIQPMTAAHYPAVRTIYEQGIATGNATFETQAPTWEAWDRAHLVHSRLVAIAGGTVLGWAALSPVSSRCVYGGVAEISLYIAADARRQGVGRQLLQSLILDSEAHGIWTLQAGTFAENTASIGLHMQAGFRVVGYRERIGQQHGVWRNTVLLERRSPYIGLT